MSGMVAIGAAACLFTSVALWKGASSFTIDAGQIGSVMLTNLRRERHEWQWIKKLWTPCFVN